METTVITPLGPVTISATAKAVTGLCFGQGKSRDQIPLLAEATEQLNQWFAGQRSEFNLPVDLKGTPFQLRVWQQLLKIPRGETRSYGQVAAAIGSPGAARAVGQACGANPLAIIVPCHRVVGSGGGLTGFAGGLELKTKLLAADRGELL